MLHTGGVAAADLAPLNEFGCRLVQTELLDVSDAFNERHARRNVHSQAPFTKGRKPDFHPPVSYTHLTLPTNHAV